MIIANIIQFLAAAYIFTMSLNSINKMDRGTRHGIRFAHISLAVGSFACLLSSFYLRDIFECLFAVGIALYVAGERRTTDV